MATGSAPIVTDVPVEHPQTHGGHFGEPVIEPYLAKHSGFYRRHMASKDIRAQSVAEGDLPTESQRRRSSVASETNEQAAPEPGLKHTEPLTAEEQPRRRSSVMKGLRWAFWYNGNE